MPDFLPHLWLGLGACIAIGALAGALTHRLPAQAMARWLMWLALAFVAGVVASALGAFAGRANVYLESALAGLALFLLGAAGGALARYRSFAAHEGWALGLPPALLIALLAAHQALPAYEQTLARRAADLAASAKIDPAGLVADGRDLRAPPQVAADASLMAALAQTKGVRRVAPTTAAAQASASAPPPPAPPPEPAKAAVAAPPEGALDLAACEAALGATASLNRIEFREASATITRDAALALDKAARVIRRCPDVVIEIIGRADNVGGAEENDALSQRRAAAAARYLRREGVAGRRLIAVGYGAAHPLASNSDEAGRALNRSVSFGVKPTM